MRLTMFSRLLIVVVVVAAAFFAFQYFTKKSGTPTPIEQTKTTENPAVANETKDDTRQR